MEERQPASTGTDAGTTRTIYYTATLNPEDASCGASATAKAWAGLVCRVLPAAQPSTGPTIADSKITGYDYWLAPTTTVETSGSTSRTTTISYDAAGRAIYTTTATKGVTGSTPRPGIFTVYNPTTGLVDARGESTSGTGITGAKQSYTYDAWGKATSFTDENNHRTTYRYDNAARLTSTTTTQATTTITYDGTDAAGSSEHRGLVTTKTITPTTAGQVPLTYKAAYNPTGALITETMPGAISAHFTLDEAGHVSTAEYHGTLTDPDTGATSTGPWLAFSQTHDIAGRTRTDIATIASSLLTTSPLEEGEAATPIEEANAAFDHRYTYTKTGQLAVVEDYTHPAAPDTATSPLITRAYTFTPNGARKNLVTTTRAEGTPTAPATDTTTQTLTYDQADRPTGGYTYDTLGRQTLIPAAHTPTPAAGNITVSYYDDDLARTITQGPTTTTFALDTTGRRATQTSQMRRVDGA